MCIPSGTPAVVTASDEEPPPMTEDGWIVATIPAGKLSALRSTVPVKPATGKTVTVKFAAVPDATLFFPGWSDRVNVGEGGPTQFSNAR
jgi:hypothetical protein